MRGLVDCALTSSGSRLAYNLLSDLGKALVTLSLLAPLLISAGQTGRWFYRGVWPTERMSLVWDELGLPHPSDSWEGVQAILNLFLAVPLCLGVMCVLVVAGYTFRVAAAVLQRCTPR